MTDYDNKTHRRVLNGMLSIVMDPARLKTRNVHKEIQKAFSHGCRSSRAAPGTTACASPASPSASTGRREREGIPVDDETWNEIRAAGVGLRLHAEKSTRSAQPQAHLSHRGR